MNPRGIRPVPYRELSIAERIQLVDAIWDSIAEDAAVHPDARPLSDAQRAELRQRLRQMNGEPGEEIAWDKVFDELLTRPE
jgi:putative addiction module component (TIGR02574 family)